MHLLEPGPDGLIHRSHAVQVGVTDTELRRSAQRDDLRRLHWGRYIATAAVEAMDDLERHVASVRAALAAQRSQTTVSHASAAVVHGLAMWNVDLGRVHLIQHRPGCGRRTQHLHVHQTSPESLSVEHVSGIPVTTVARTVFDVATDVGFEEAVVIADGALKRNLTTVAALQAELALGQHRSGRRRAAAVVAFADGRSESVGESRSRVGMMRAGIPSPVLQHRVVDANGVEAGRSDFAWVDQHLLGEFDGRAKYGRLLTPGQQPADVFLAERQRQERLHDLDFEMVRWLWRELSRPDLLYPRIRAALLRSARLHPC